MFHSRKLNNRINYIHERALRLVYKDDLSSFNELLAIDNSVTIHHRNLQALAIEIFKLKNGYAPDILQEIFELREPPYNLRDKRKHFWKKKIRTTKYGLQSIKYLAPKIWELVPQNIKNCESLESFKSAIKSWSTDECPCRLCKRYIAQVGFM